MMMLNAAHTRINGAPDTLVRKDMYSHIGIPVSSSSNGRFDLLRKELKCIQYGSDTAPCHQFYLSRPLRQVLPHRGKYGVLSICY